MSNTDSKIIIMDNQTKEPKPVKERDNLDLLELVCQLHWRAAVYKTQVMHDAYVEARTELESRLSPVTHLPSPESDVEKSVVSKEDVKLTEKDIEFLKECNLHPHYEDGKICAAKVMTEDSEGAFLTKQDLIKLSTILLKLANNE